MYINLFIFDVTLRLLRSLKTNCKGSYIFKFYKKDFYPKFLMKLDNLPDKFSSTFTNGKRTVFSDNPK